MYKIVTTISLIIRQFYLPNPYEKIFPEEWAAVLFNLAVGGAILHYLSFFMTGIFYKKGDYPVLGSVLYLFCYIVNTFIITIAGVYIRNFELMVILLVGLYITIFILLFALQNKVIDGNRY